MSQYEIEIKSLLGSQEKADALKEKIKAKGAVVIAQNKQLNHYFVINDIEKFKERATTLVSSADQDRLNKILAEGSNFSIRTRDTDGKVVLVIKASIGSDTSANGVSRMEFEAEVSMSLDELDKALLENGLDYQAKWSREREEYKLGEAHICLDKNAGYGYLAEFERVVADRSLADSTKRDLLELMQGCGVEELVQDRLERMFAYYNANWRDYYGTDKVFNIQ